MNNRVCMVVYQYYPRDQRVRKEAEALMRNGFEVEVICIRKPGEKTRDTVNGVRVWRLPMQADKAGGRLGYAYQYLVFFVLAMLAIEIEHIRHRFGVIHVNSLPDFLVFTAVFPKLTGAKVVLDLHEAMPEIYRSKMGRKDEEDFLFRLIVLLERMSMAYADRIITVSDLIGDIFITRGLPRDKLTIIWNTADIEKPLEPVLGAEKRIVYAGTINEYQDFDTLLAGLAEMRDVELDIYSDETAAERLGGRVTELDLKNVHFMGWVNPQELRKRIVGYAGTIIPSGGSDVAKIALGHKALEYPLLGLPVVATDLPGIRAVFDDSCFYFYQVGQPEDFIRAVRALFSDRDAARRKVLKSQEVIEKRGLTWGNVEKRLIELYRKLSDE